MRRTSILSCVGTLIVATACSGPTIRSCTVGDILQPQASDSLEYTAWVPSECRVPLGIIGETKSIGATITDKGTQNYLYVIVSVLNGDNDNKGNDIELFLNFGSYSRAEPMVSFPAATGTTETLVEGQNVSSEGTDRGFFSAVRMNLNVGAQTTLYVTYKGSNVRAQITGPDVPAPNAQGTWYPSVSGGSSPYTYDWYRNGSYVHTGSSYTASAGSSEFGLRLVVTDNASASRWTDYWVNVGGIKTSISGPTTVYYSEGDGTWTANTEGGVTPYTVTWYYDSGGTQTYIGTGASIQWYPAYAGQYTLIANVVDSNSRATTSSIIIHAIGDGQGGCVPTPPQIICDP